MKELFQENFNVHKFTYEKYHVELNNTNSIWLIDYYAPWCPHCQHFAPVWQAIADHFATSRDIHVGTVDCTVERVICIEERIYGYPAIKAFIHSKEYMQMNHGQRDVDGIVQWLEELLKNDKIHVDRTGIPSQQYKGIEKVIPEPLDLVLTHKKLRSARLIDASRAFVSSLEHIDASSTQRYHAALDWIDAVRHSFPLESHRQEIQLLYEAVAKEKTDWKTAVREWKEENSFFQGPVHWGEQCSTYFCGLWTLFHMMSLNTIDANAILKGMNGFLQHFFDCKTCIREFGSPEVEYNKTTLMLELWKQHNIANEKSKHPTWPSKQDCAVCYRRNDTVAHDQVVKYLEMSYYLPESSSPVAMVANVLSNDWLSTVWGLQIFVVMLVLWFFRGSIFRFKQTHED